MCKKDEKSYRETDNDEEDTNDLQETTKRGGIIMATQIAATPILYGEEAKKIIQEAKTMPSEKAKENAHRILNYFSKFTKKGE